MTCSQLAVILSGVEGSRGIGPKSPVFPRDPLTPLHSAQDDSGEDGGIYFAASKGEVVGHPVGSFGAALGSYADSVQSCRAG